MSLAKPKPAFKKKLILSIDTITTPSTTNLATNKISQKSDDLNIENQKGGVKKINEGRIGAISKKLLRAFKSKRLGKDVKKMSQEDYDNEVILYNIDVEQQKQVKKVTAKKVLKELEALPFIEPLQTKQQRKEIQQKEFRLNANKKQVKQLENKFIDMRTNQRKSIEVKFNNKLSIADNLKNAINTIQNINKDQRFNLIVNGKYYALNENTKDRLFKAVEDNNIVASEEFGSDKTIAYELLQNIDKFTLEVFEKKHKNNQHNGAFFKYKNNTTFDLQKYQIFNKIINNKNDFKTADYAYTDYNVKGLYDNCLIYALRIGGLENSKLEALKLKCKVDNIPLSKLNEICLEIGIAVELTKEKYTDRNKVSEAIVEIFGDVKNDIYKIGLLDEHYFINEHTNITSFSIKNYNEIKELKDYNLISERNGKYFKKDIKRCLMSYDVIKLFLEYKETHLELITKNELNHTQLHKKVDNVVTDLDYEPVENITYREVKVGSNEKEIILNRVNIFYDFETYTDVNNKTEKIHIPYLCCYTDDNNNKMSFYGIDCGLEMLQDLSSKHKNIRLIAHNASYDIKFLYKYLFNIREISKGKQIICSKAIFNGMKILMKDSYSLISMPLKKFPKTFNIPNNVKEVISYNFYNKTDAINKKFVKISDTIEYLINEDKSVEQFKENLVKWDLIRGDLYDCVEYSKRYCEIDCFILKEGYNTFKSWMIDLVNIDIDYSLTIASLAHRYFIEQDCYEDVFELSGVCQSFIQKCVVGGRTMLADNTKRIFLEDEGRRINDFDAVSLYPSAMNRMEGFLQGLPKVITNLDYENLKLTDGYFVEIKITKVGIKKHFPLASYIREDGVRHWTNDLEGQIINIDKVALEDLIRFQSVEFEIVKGYYFDEGFNPKIKDVIKTLFEERKKLKANKNGAEIVYKLIMNSGYGKSIMKEVDSEIKYFNSKAELDVYVSRNYNWVSTWEQLDNSNTYKVKIVKAVNTHFNIAQVGVSILSWSKRIMNEVICLADDINIPIYYQDTDSLHIDDKNIDLLASQFKEKYNRELIGTELGQFHSDFDMEGCKNVIAVSSVFLGKKCYIDKLQGEDIITGEIKNDYHIRLKGVPTDCIKWTAEKLKYENVFDLYVEMYKSTEVEFDLTQGLTKDNFKFNSNGTIKTLLEFKRRIKF